MTSNSCVTNAAADCTIPPIRWRYVANQLSISTSPILNDPSSSLHVFLRVSMVSVHILTILSRLSNCPALPTSPSHSAHPAPCAFLPQRNLSCSPHCATYTNLRTTTCALAIPCVRALPICIARCWYDHPGIVSGEMPRDDEDFS